MDHGKINKLLQELQEEIVKSNNDERIDSILKELKEIIDKY